MQLLFIVHLYQHYFQGWDQARIHCPRKITGNFSCCDPGGCEARGEPCLVFLIKQVWLLARFPTIKDKEILAKLKKLQLQYHKQSKMKFSDKFDQNLNEMFSLAPSNFVDLLMASDMEQQEKVNAVRILQDYVGPEASRYPILDTRI